MKTVKERIESIKNELRYNSGPAIPYIRVSTQDARMLVQMAEENARLQALADFEVKQSIKANQENARQRKALEEIYASDSLYTIHGIASEELNDQ